MASPRPASKLIARSLPTGGIYYMRWLGAELRFKDAASPDGVSNRTRETPPRPVRAGGREVPDHWRVFVTRQAPPLKGLIGTSLARNAATPIGAMLNYVFAVALGQCTRAVIGAGMDPCVGFVHVPRQGRLSLAYDVLELHRADLTGAIFDHVARASFVRSDFEQSQTGVVSLGPAVARDCAAIALKIATIGACEKSVHRIVAWL
jgi:hypothetical protein